MVYLFDETRWCIFHDKYILCFKNRYSKSRMKMQSELENPRKTNVVVRYPINKSINLNSMEKNWRKRWLRKVFHRKLWTLEGSMCESGTTEESTRFLRGAGRVPRPDLPPVAYVRRWALARRTQGTVAWARRHAPPGRRASCPGPSVQPLRAVGPCGVWRVAAIALALTARYPYPYISTGI